MAVAPAIWVMSLVVVNAVFQSVVAEERGRGNVPGSIATHSPPPPGSLPPPPPPSPPPASKSNATPFRPSVAVIVGVLTTLFSITFLLLLYAKHCSGAAARSSNAHFSMGGAAARRNSGIDRVVVESLPLFRFGSLMGHKDGLECAVCLARFEATELLRLLPKCKHAFHVECVDTWLDAHSTCPLCRYRVDPEDVLLVDERKAPGDLFKEPAPEAIPLASRRISGRHSSAGEKSTGLIQAAMNAAFNRRRSVDEAGSLGCFDRGRKDAALSTERERFEHRIVISDAETTPPPLLPALEVRQTPKDLLFIRLEEVIRPAWGRASCSALHKKSSCREVAGEVRLVVTEDPEGGGRSVMSTRCVSEITGLSRFRRQDEVEMVSGAGAGENNDKADTKS